MTRPAGSVKLLGIVDQTSLADLIPRVENLGQSLRKRGVFVTWSVIDSTDYVTGIITGLQALKSAFFRPNILPLNLPDPAPRISEIERVVGEAKRLGVGVALLGMHPKAGLGRETVVNVWLRPPEIGETVASALSRSNMHLGILLAYRLARAWDAELNLLSVAPQESDRDRVHAYIEEMRDLCRIPAGARTLVLVGEFEERLVDAPQSDIDFFGMPKDLQLAFAVRMVAATRSSCIFTVDSGHENALA